MKPDVAYKEVQEKIASLLDELVSLIRPQGICTNPDCDCKAPDGPWMVHGWVLAVDTTAEGDDGEIETWTQIWRSKGIPRTQAVGLGHSIVKSLE